MKRLLSNLRLLVLIIFFPNVCLSAEITLTVEKVINGQSFVATKGEIVRLASIEAPLAEEGSPPAAATSLQTPFGKESREALSALIQGKTITLH